MSIQTRRTYRPNGLTSTQRGGLPVPLRLTHKQRVEAQVVHRWWRREVDRFRLTAQWSGEHPHYLPAGDGGPSLPLLAETLRQSVITISHAAYAVPHDHAFVMKALSVEFSDVSPALSPLHDINVDLRCHDVLISHDQLRSMEIDLDFLHAGTRFARGTGSLTLLPANVYQRLRRAQALVQHRTTGTRVAPSEVGRFAERDVLLVSAPGPSHHLAVDTGHPWHFDHPADHLPGMLFVEAAVQCHQLHTSDAAPRALSVHFGKYAEVASEVSVITESGHDGTAIRFIQDGCPVASAAVRAT